MSIPLQQARGIFTEAAIAVYRENAPVPSFLKNMFSPTTTDAKQVSIEVQRDTEYIAVDVNRGGKGNRNTFSLSTVKEYLPPMFDENFDATMMDRYDVAFGQGNAVPRTIGMIAKDVGMKLARLQAKLDRAKEKQCGQVFETGIVTMENGDNIDFKRQAGSKVDPGAGNYWATVTAAIEAQIIAAGTFFRTQGKSAVKELDMIMSSASWIDLKNSNYFKNIANFNQVTLIDVVRPIAQASGSTFHGQIDAGQFKVNCWVYDETYDVAGGSSGVRYISENQTVFLPVSGSKLIMAHAGIPAIIRDKRNAEFPEYLKQVKAESWVNNYIDKKGKSHTFELLSAFCAVPVSVDLIYTLQTRA